MSTQLTSIHENDTYHPNLYPSKDVNTDNMEKQGKMQDAIKNIRKTFQPDVDTCKFYLVIKFYHFNIYRVDCTN